MKRARIYLPTRNAMQSGKRASSQWCLEFMPECTGFIDPVIGWTGSSDMYANEVKLFFKDMDCAIEYAERNGIEFELLEHQESKPKISPYINNFLK
jgi:hypothetical protein